jgi:hypothetical protein
MVRRIARWTGLVLLSGTMTVAGTVPALASPSTGSGGWRVVATFSAAKDPRALDNVVAFSARDAWAAGTEGVGKSSFSAFVLNWAGRGWHQVTLPRSVRKVLGGTAIVTGSSASDVWLSDQTGWARWNGKSWKAGQIPLAAKNRPAGQLLAFSPTNAWFIGQYFTTHKSFAEHFNGRSWRAMPAPPINFVLLSGVSASAICAMNGQFGTSATTTVLACWNGHRWNRLKLPAALSHRHAVIGSILVRSLHDIWVGGGQIGGKGGTPGLAAHWTGTGWHVTVLPAVTTLGTDVLNLLVSDQQGGLWAMGDCDCGGPAWRLWHYTGGRWTGPSLPVIGGTAGIVTGIAGIPGTRSAWATGQRFTDTSTDSVILVNGRLPS